MSDQPHPNALRLGLLVLGSLAVLTAIEFALALTFNRWEILAILAIIKAGLVLYYYMHIQVLFQPDESRDRHSYEYKLVTNRIGLWLFMISDFFIFGGLLISRINLLGLTRPDLNQVLGLVITSILLISSFFANRGETFMKNGDIRQFKWSFIATITLGLLFILGVVGIEWRIAPFGPADGVQGAVFYTMTAFHAFHVLTGVVFLAFVLRKGVRGMYTPQQHWGVEAAAVYWHFVDVVWVFFYPALYLIGSLH